MDDRYSLSDRQIYGAEDDFEMEMILAAIDRALEEPRRPAEKPRRATAEPRRTVEKPRRATAEPRRTVEKPRRATAEPRRTVEKPNRGTANPRSVAPVSTELCSKTPYRTQEAARTALERWQAAEPDDPKVPHRVYPCDRCDAWHLTRKRSGRGVPPWDRNPNWTRSPEQLAKLQPRFEGKPKGSR